MGGRKKVFVHLESGRGYSRDLLRGIYAFNNRYTNWEIVFEPAYFLHPSRASNNLSIIESVKPDGCIVEFPHNLDAIVAKGIPVVQATSIGCRRGVPFIKGDYEADGRMAVDYFTGRGFTHLGFFGIEGLEWSEARSASFVQQAQKKGLEPSVCLLKGDENDVLAFNFTRLENWVQALAKPAGILCCNDAFAQILINTCSLAGIRVPAEAAILGIDNDELICNITFPNLSSIARNHQETAAGICRLLEEMMNGCPPSRDHITTLPVEVVERTSTDTLATPDAKVAQAIQFISTHLHLPIGVSDVAASCRLGRKQLNERFKAATGNTILEEIQARKLRRFKALLKDKQLSVKEIGYELGFEDATHVSRWFASREGIPPLKWRQLYAEK